MALIQNKKATFDFEILKKFEAGIELFGHEVKSVRNKRGSLLGAHVLVRGGEAFLINASIPPYQVGNTPESYDPERPRRLLLNKRELIELTESDTQKGLTLVPISLYNNKRKIKLEFALVRGKKMHDKRESIKERDSKRSIARTLKMKNR